MKASSLPLLILGVIISIALLALNIGLALRNASIVRQETLSIAHTQEVRLNVAQLLSLITDAETGARGYALTGDAIYLEPYQRALKSIPERETDLATLVQDNASQQSRIRELRQHIKDKLRLLQEAIKIRQEKGLDGILEYANNQGHTSANAMASIRTIVEEMHSDEKRMLEERTYNAESSYLTSTITTLVTGSGAIIAILAFASLFYRFTLHRTATSNLIKERSEQLRITLASIGEGVISTDAQGRVVSMNAVAEQLTGWKQSEAEGKALTDVFEIVNEATRQAVENPAMRALAAGTIVGLANHTVLIARNGSERPIDDSAAPIRDSEGQIKGCVLVFRDVSERRDHERLLRQSELTYRETFDRAPIGIAHVSNRGAILRVNEVFSEITGFNKSELEGMHVRNLAHDDDLTLIDSNIEKLVRGDITDFWMETQYVTKGGQKTWISITVSPVARTGEKSDFYVAMVEDIQESRRAEENRVRLAAIVQSSNDAIIGKSLQGMVSSWNPAAERLFGYSESEMVGASVSQIVLPEHWKDELDLLDRLRRGEIIEQVEAVRRRKDGTQIEVLLNLSPIRGSNGEITGISTIARDITEKKKSDRSLQESESRLRTLADNISQSAWMANPNGDIYWYNKRWYDYTGMSVGEQSKIGWSNLCHPDFRSDVLASVQQSLETGQPWEHTFPLKGKDDQYRWFLSRAVPIRDARGVILHWFGSNTDITDIKKYEERVEQARQIAENANNSRGEFLANMSHEIRTPMTAILGYADILADHVRDPDDLQCVHTIRRNGKFLLQIINDILDLSKIDAGKFQADRQRVKPEVVVAEVQSLMEVRAHEKKLAFEVKTEGKIPNAIETDEVRLRQILLNLIGNAIKFTDQGRIDVVVRYLPVENQMQFVVRDTGIGIPRDAISKLFTPFMQVDTSSTRAYEGTGLGLAISRRLAQSLGGDISVISQLGVGSTFTLTIRCGVLEDVSLVEPKGAEPSPEPVPELANKIDACVLVVDDRHDIRFLAQYLIEKAGGRVITATNGLEAIEFLFSGSDSAQSVDIVIMDMQMPVMDGYDAAREIRRRGFQKPIIALTANAMKEDRAHCIEAGCNDYTTKPLDSRRVIQLIAKYVPK